MKRPLIFAVALILAAFAMQLPSAIVNSISAAKPLMIGTTNEQPINIYFWASNATAISAAIGGGGGGGSDVYNPANFLTNLSGQIDVQGPLKYLTSNNAANLTNLQAPQLTGTVPYASLPSGLASNNNAANLTFDGSLAVDGAINCSATVNGNAAAVTAGISGGSLVIASNGYIATNFYVGQTLYSLVAQVTNGTTTGVLTVLTNGVIATNLWVGQTITGNGLVISNGATIGGTATINGGTINLVNPSGSSVTLNLNAEGVGGINTSIATSPAGIIFANAGFFPALTAGGNFTGLEGVAAGSLLVESNAVISTNLNVGQTITGNALYISNGVSASNLDASLGFHVITGCYHDCQYATNGAVTNSVNFYGGPFTGADAGKEIDIGTGSSQQTFTIATFVNSGEVTLSGSYSGTITETPYAFGHDDSAAINSQVSNYWTFSNLSTFIFPAGNYFLNTWTPVLGPTYAMATALWLPQTNAALLTNSPRTLKLMGFEQPMGSGTYFNVSSSYGPQPLNTNGVIFSCFLPPQANGTYTNCIIGQSRPSYEEPSGIGGFLLLNLELEDITFRTYTNCQYTAVDLGCVAQCDLHNVMVDTGQETSFINSAPTATSSFGIRFPLVNNYASCYARNCTVVGYYEAYGISEHLEASGLNAWSDAGGIQFLQGNHPNFLSRLLIQGCPTHLYNAGAVNTTYISEYAAEIDTASTVNAWQKFAWNLYDPSNDQYGGCGIVSCYNPTAAQWVSATNMGATNFNMPNRNVALTGNNKSQFTSLTVNSNAAVFNAGLNVANGLLQVNGTNATAGQLLQAGAAGQVAFAPAPSSYGNAPSNSILGNNSLVTATGAWLTNLPVNVLGDPTNTIANCGVQTPNTPYPFWVISGDSLSSGYLSVTPYAADLTNNLGFSVSGYNNSAVAGQTAGTILTNYVTQIASHWPNNTPTATNRVLFEWSGINDLGEGFTAAQTYGFLTNIWWKAHTNGALVVAFTVTASLNYASPSTLQQVESNRLTLNQMIRNSPQLWDYLEDVSAWLPTPQEAPDLYVDNIVHLTSASQYQLAQDVEWVVTRGFHTVTTHPYDHYVPNGNMLYYNSPDGAYMAARGWAFTGQLLGASGYPGLLCDNTVGAIGMLADGATGYLLGATANGANATAFEQFDTLGVGFLNSNVRFASNVISTNGFSSYATNRTASQLFNTGSLGTTNISGRNIEVDVNASSATIVKFDSAGAAWDTNTSLTLAYVPIFLQAGAYFTNNGTVTITGQHVQ